MNHKHMSRFFLSAVNGRVLTLCVLTLLFGATTALAQRNYPPTFEGARDEVYKQIGDVKLKLWVFEPEDLKPDDQRPAIVFFFGGGWRSGTPAQFEQHCRYLASHGMVAVTADYRVLSRHNTPAVRCVADAKSAVRWIRENADRLGVDPNRIVAAGGSAGGHLAACTGVIEGYDEPSESEEVSSVPNALALFNPAVVLAPADGVELNAERLGNLKERMGVEPRELSPFHHVRAGLPPTIIFHGQADATVPFNTVKRYTEAARAVGNRCELDAYADAGHGFFNYGRGGTPGESYVATVRRLHQFLGSLGYVNGDPTIELADNVPIPATAR